MIKLPRYIPEFPRAAPQEAHRNAWGSQWRYLPRSIRSLVCSAGRLRKLQER